MEINLGTKLRSAREAAGITIDDVVYIGKLPRSVVLALEAEDFGFFTSPLYARSFLKQYGAYIGADVTQWINDLVPTTLLDGDTIDSFIDFSNSEPSKKHREKARSGNHSSGAMAAVWMIVITGGLIYGGLKIFENLESRLSQADEQDLKLPTPVKAPTQTTPAVIQKPEQSTAATNPSPTQRAIIVHEE